MRSAKCEIREIQNSAFCISHFAFRTSSSSPASASRDIVHHFNLGARHACGTYLAFLDSDDLWFPWTLEVYQEVIQKYGQPSFVAGRPYQFSDQHELEKVIFGVMRTNNPLCAFLSQASHARLRQQPAASLKEPWNVCLRHGLASALIVAAWFVSEPARDFK